MELERVAWVAFLVGWCIALLLIDDGYDRMDIVVVVLLRRFLYRFGSKTVNQVVSTRIVGME
jgi:hypothetical protein